MIFLFALPNLMAAEPNIQLPQVIQTTPIDYPQVAIDQKLEGNVLANLSIDIQGRVQNCEIIESSNQLFDASTCRTLDGYRFSPAKSLDGETIPIQIQYRLQFQLNKVAPVSIAGILKAASLKSPISNQNIRAIGPNGLIAETVTDETGKFQFRGLSNGKWTIAVPNPKYQNPSLDVEVNNTTIQDLEWYLVIDKAKAAQSDLEITVVARKDTSNITERALSSDEIYYLPGSAGDVVKAVQNLPGIARAPLGVGQLIIRGTAPEDSAYYIDGVLIPDVFHFGGLTTVINSDSIEEVAYLPGNYSVKYGRQLGGLVDLRTASEIPERDRSYISVDVYQSTAFTEQRINDEWALSFSGRRSYADVILSPLLSSSDLTVRAPRYYDAQARVLYRPSQTEVVDILYFMSDDEFRFLGQDAEGKSETIISFGRNFHKVRGKWLRRNGTFNRETIVNVGPARQDFTFQIDGVGYEQTWGINLREEAYQVLSEDRNLAYRFGMDLDFGLDSFKYDFPDFPGEAEGAESVYLAPAFYLEQSVQFSRGTLIPGIRIGSYAVNGQICVPAFDPRLSGRIDLNDSSTMKFGAGTFSQYPTPRQLIPESDGNANLVRARSFQYSLGVEQQITGRFRSELTGFYNELDDLVVGREDRFRFFTGPPPIGPFDTQPYANAGSGEVYGLEQLLRYDGTNTLALVAVTLSRSLRTGRNGEAQLFTFDQPVVLNALATRQLPKNWRLGARYRYGSGNPYTPVTNRIYDLTSREFVPVYGERDSARLPPFKSLDVRIDKDYVYDKWTLTAYLDIQNATYSRNVEVQAWSYDFGQAEPIESNPPLPAFGFKGEW
ncbi:MAG: TonB family protein [Myxococcota bacterium]|nr:TonB family protein [Myxococcota bacterium]